MIDTIIIGKGAAGITAAIYLKRYNKNVLVIGKDLGALEKTVKIENYYGFPTGIDGKELIQNGITQAKHLGIDVYDEEVVQIDNTLEYFLVTTPNHEYKAKTVLIATGKKRTPINVKGFKHLQGKGISFCVTCDGFFFRNKRLALVGYNDFMLHELSDMELLTKDITVFTEGNELTAPVKHKVVTDKIIEFVGDDVLTGVKTENGSYDFDGVFIALGTPSAADFALRVGAILDNNNLVVNASYQTNIEGLYAAGDAIGGTLQLTKASYDGMMAAMHIKNKLNDLKRLSK